MRHRWIILILIALCLPVLDGSAVTVQLENGQTRFGFLTVREFDEVYVTINNRTNNKLFQFTASNVACASDSVAIFLAEKTELKSKPAADSAAALPVPVLAGQTVDFVDDEGKIIKPHEAARAKEVDGWVHVQVWGDKQGWIPKKLLTKYIVRENGRFVSLEKAKKK